MKKIILIIFIIFLTSEICYAYTYNSVSLDTTDLESYMSENFPEFNLQDFLEKLTLGDFKAIAYDIYQYFLDGLKSLIDYHKDIMYTLFGLCIASAMINHISIDDKYNGGVILLCAISLVLIKFYIDIYLIANKVILNIFNLNLPQYIPHI